MDIKTWMCGGPWEGVGRQGTISQETCPFLEITYPPTVDRGGEAVQVPLHRVAEVFNFVGEVIGLLRKKLVPVILLPAAVLMLFPRNAYAMHIMEGFLPLSWCLVWGAATLPFFLAGMLSLSKKVKLHPEMKMLLGLAGAFAFVLSALKIPSVTGSCSHPTGVGLGAVLFGPFAMTVLGCIVLIFQALLLAHGGISTLGANTFSMAVVGPLVAYAVYRLCLKLRAPLGLGVFLAAALGDLLTYVTTSFQLALAFPDQAGGLMLSFAKFMGVFALTQVPLAVSEGLLTVVIFNWLTVHSKQELRELAILPGDAPFLEGRKR